MAAVAAARRSTSRTPPTDRVGLHRAAVAYVIRTLRRHGHSVTKHARRGHDLVVDGRTVDIRAARGGEADHEVRVNGRRYKYRYRHLAFNLHRHGRYPTRAPAFWICAGQDGDGSVWRYFIVPERRVRGRLTVDLLTGSHLGRSLLARHEGRWDLLTTKRRLTSLR